MWKLDRLGRSLPHLLQIVTTLHDAAHGLSFRMACRGATLNKPQEAGHSRSHEGWSASTSRAAPLSRSFTRVENIYVRRHPGRFCGTPSPLPRRPLGQTGAVSPSSGSAARGPTYDRAAEAVRVIQRALEHGVNYCDTAPAYAGSLDYYGAALGERRAEIFLASKTHDRTRDGSLRLLEHSLRRLRTTTSISGSCMTSVPGETWSVFSARVVRSRPWSRLVRRAWCSFAG